VTILLFAARKCNVNAVDFKSRNALDWSLQKSKGPVPRNATDTMTLCSLLLASGVKATVADSNGRTPLLKALDIHSENKPLIDMLRSAGSAKTRDIRSFFQPQPKEVN